MAIFSCPHCSWRVRFAEPELGKKSNCIQCGQPIVFPLTLEAKAAELPPAPMRSRARKIRSLAAWPWAALAAVVVVASVSAFLILSPSRAEPRNTDVFGRVTYQNKPLTGGTISFVSVKGPLKASIARDGSYRLNNCPPGTVSATVRHVSSTLEKEQGDKIHWLAKSLIPTKYQSPRTSGLEYTIAGERQEINIELSD